MLAQSPDARSAQAAKALARPGPWSELGATESLVFGRCQGSGKTPYQVTVDLTGPAYRCTCPSRKQPCKHGVALLLLWVEHGDALGALGAGAGRPPGPPVPPPGRAGAKGPRRPAADPEAQARRRAEREATMSAGIDELERWLGDLVRQGLAGARRQPYAFWDGMASRLVDAQMPGLAERVRSMGGRLVGRLDWADLLLAEIGRWQLAIRAWRARDRLGPELLADLRVYLGWYLRGDELADLPQVADQWVVAGVRQDELEQVVSQRTWLYGETTGRWVLLLDFAAAGGTLRTAQTVGSVVDAALALHPGSDPPRGVLGDDVRVVASGALPKATGVAEAVDRLSAHLAANPWRERLPVALARVVAVPDGDRWWLQDVTDHERLPLSRLVAPWTLLALTGGRPATVVAEWEAGALHPLAVAPTVPSATAVRTADPVPL